MTKIETITRNSGLFVRTWAPGDGVRRYRFFTTNLDYHSGGHLFTALGTKEALIWISGYEAGRGNARPINARNEPYIKSNNPCDVFLRTEEQ